MKLTKKKRQEKGIMKREGSLEKEGKVRKRRRGTREA